MTSLGLAGLDETAERLRRGEVSAREVGDACLARIEEHAHRLAAFTQVFAAEARAQADALDRDRSAGRIRGPLHGVPVAVKDLMDIEGHTTTCGTALRRHAPPATRTAPAVAALVDAGAVVVGMTNLHEWADGATSSNPHFGFVRNPWDETRIPGGSSGGSAVAVATGMAFAALGTDTGGSVRIPAACTGTAGLKVTEGRISTELVHPLSWSLDTVGPHARRVRDLVTPYRVLTGAAAPPWREPAGATLGIARDRYFEAARIDPAVLAATTAALEQLEEAGVRVVEVELPELAGAEELVYAILLVEAAAVHDGERRADRASYGEDIRRYLAQGDEVRAVDYIRALRGRGELRRGFERVFAEVDFLVSPTLPMLPPPIGVEEHVWPDGSVEQVGGIWRHTFPSNLVGIPSLSQPCGLSEEGLPVALQLIAPWGSELELLALGCALEDVFGWDFRPPGY